MPNRSLSPPVRGAITVIRLPGICAFKVLINARDVATFVKNILSHILNRVRHGYSVNPKTNYPFRMDSKQSDQCDRAEIEPQPAAASVVARYV